MAVTTVARPGDFAATFTFPNTTTPDTIMYGVVAPGQTGAGKIYRQRIRKDGASPLVGGPGTWVDTGLTIADVSIVGDL